MAFSSVVTEHINASPEVVFAAACDFATAPQRITGIRKLEMLTDGPVGVGTRFRETRVMFGKEARTTMEVIEFQPGRSYTLRADEGGCEYRTQVSVRPSPTRGACEITFDLSGTPHTLGAKVLAFAMGWLINGACTKAIGKDLTDLKTALEKTVA